MAEIAAPHPGRARTRDDNDPAVIKDRARCLAAQRRRRETNPVEYLRKKAEYAARHKAEHAAYAKRWYLAKKAAMAAKEAADQCPVVSIM